jgi:aminopeptidase N
VKEEDRIYVIYLHLVFSLIENIKDFSELGPFVEKIQPINQIIEEVNNVNAHCIEANLKKLGHPKEKSKVNFLESDYFIEIVKERNIAISSNHRLTISKNYIDKALSSLGECDLHFFAFVAHKLDFVPVIHYFAFCNKAIDISEKYA